MPLGTLHLTHNGVRLHQPPYQQPGENLLCGYGFPLQVSPTEVALLVNIRNTGAAVVDFEIGWDFLVFGCLDEIRTERLTKGLRQTSELHPRTGRELTMVQHLPHGGFVPLGAKMPDGRPHPHAGTGLGISIVHGYPADNSDRHAHVAPDLHTYWRLIQFLYDGQTFEISSIRNLENEDFLPGWSFTNRGLSAAIRDGEDLLFPMAGGPAGSEAGGCGIGRWRRDVNGWHLADFTPVGENDDSYEPTLLRDHDNSLLMCVRGVRNSVDRLLHFHVYRSLDSGITWNTVIDLPNQRAGSPVTLLQTTKGHPFMAANPWLGRELGTNGQPISAYSTRHRLWFWPLSADRHSLLSPYEAFNANEILGPPRDWPSLPNDNLWYADHPIGGLFRLADGHWHSLVTFRISDIALNTGGASFLPHFGTWLEEVLDSTHSNFCTVLPWEF